MKFWVASEQDPQWHQLVREVYQELVACGCSNRQIQTFAMALKAEASEKSQGREPLGISGWKPFPHYDLSLLGLIGDS